MTPALDRHPVVAASLTSRAQEVSRDPQSEVAIVVARGPEADASNVKWLADMKAISDAIAARLPFARVEFQADMMRIRCCCRLEASSRVGWIGLPPLSRK